MHSFKGCLAFIICFFIIQSFQSGHFMCSWAAKSDKNQIRFFIYFLFFCHLKYSNLAYALHLSLVSLSCFRSQDISLITGMFHNALIPFFCWMRSETFHRVKKLLNWSFITPCVWLSVWAWIFLTSVVYLFVCFCKWSWYGEPKCLPLFPSLTMQAWDHRLDEIWSAGTRSGRMLLIWCCSA